MISQQLALCFCDVLRQPMPAGFECATIAELPGWDSVAHLSLMMEIEKRFQIRFRATELFAITTIPALIAVIEERQHA